MTKTRGAQKIDPTLTAKNLELTIANLALVKTNRFLEEFQKKLSKRGDADKAGLGEIIRKEIEKNMELRYLIKQAAKEATTSRADKLKLVQSNDLLHISKSVLTKDLRLEKARSTKLRSQLETASFDSISVAELLQKDAEIEQLTREILTIAKISSHDLQEPLKNIQVFSALLLEKEHHNLSKEGKEYFERMQKSAARVRRLMQDLSEYSHLNKAFYKVVKTDLNKVLAEALKELIVSIRKTHTVVTSEKLPAIVVAPLHFRKIFKELLCNSMKFARPRLRPRVHIDHSIVVGGSEKEKGLGIRKKYHKISFTDNGIGFNPHYKDRIFEVFQKLGEKDQVGTGIGLASCKKIIENYNGRITANSKVGKGSTFVIYIPA